MSTLCAVLLSICLLLSVVANIIMVMLAAGMVEAADKLMPKIENMFKRLLGQ